MIKTPWFNILFWSIAGIVLWSILFTIAYCSQQTLKDALTISSVIVMGATLLAILIKLGLFERLLVKYRNSKFNITATKSPDKKITIDQYHKVLKKRPWWPLLTNLLVYMIILIVAIIM